MPMILFIKLPGTPRGVGLRTMPLQRSMYAESSGTVALDHLQRSLTAGADNLNARNLATIVLRTTRQKRRSE